MIMYLNNRSSISSTMDLFLSSTNRPNSFLGVGLMRVAFALIMATCFSLTSEANEASVVDQLYEMQPTEYPDAISNPLKGFRPNIDSKLEDHRYATIARCYLKWSDLENAESDGIAKIKEVCNRKWKNLANTNTKVVPRVYLDWNEKQGNEYWPADLKSGDYSSKKFRRRLIRLIDRLGECWDQDPRVAWVQMGFVGYWGEHHSPAPSQELQDLLGGAFSRAFQHKKVLVRHADEFENYQFGIYWDSWAHSQQTNSSRHGAGIDELNKKKGRWKTHPIEGEAAYNWGEYQTQPGDDPDDTLLDPIHRDFLIDTIRKLHCTGLGWIANYSQDSPDVQLGAAEVQKAFGYRFVIDQFSSSRRVEPNGKLRVKFIVRNTGSAPFYENWPVELSLLDPSTGTVAWSALLHDVDIRKWLPGDDWDESEDIYRIPPSKNVVDVSQSLPSLKELPPGEYAIALSLLDPNSGQPSIRFAVQNHLADGRHPFCLVGVGMNVAKGHELESTDFDNSIQ